TASSPPSGQGSSGCSAAPTWSRSAPHWPAPPRDGKGAPVYADPTDPHHLTPDQRLAEVAALLAKGVARLLALRADHPVSLPPESTHNRLDESRDLSLHVSRPVNATGEPRRSSR